MQNARLKRDCIFMTNTKYKLAIALIITILVYAMTKDTVTPVAAKKIIPRPSYAVTDTHNQAIMDYIRSIFGTCSSDAFSYLDTINPSYDPLYIHHNYIGNRYFSSDYGLFALSDQLPETRGYDTNELFNYQINTQIAYLLFKENDYRFDTFNCIDK